ncbi:hypothetical protein PHYPSEUDO_010557 [Phytophthora pseudosyringae]|uniref:Elicitin n=1 Tax=Phytophthora pseudosyringae TaxID=221518 RepID=A0A8T1VCZ5_9STRA|nr:hypothetical protein PHYPSEUDO_010557 [Phytophthora pseudosyringae]
MCNCISASIALFLPVLLSTSIPSVLATTECAADVSYPITAMLDNGKLFSTCAMESVGVRINARSLFDVRNFSDRDFLLFCRAPSCIKPVETLRESIPTDCLITYHGSARNLSDEVSTLYRECARVVGAADKTDEDYVYRYFLD